MPAIDVCTFVCEDRLDFSRRQLRTQPLAGHDHRRSSRDAVRERTVQRKPQGRRGLIRTGKPDASSDDAQQIDVPLVHSPSLTHCAPQVDDPADCAAAQHRNPDNPDDGLDAGRYVALKGEPALVCDVDQGRHAPMTGDRTEHDRYRNADQGAHNERRPRQERDVRIDTSVDHRPHQQWRGSRNQQPTEGPQEYGSHL